MATEENKTEEPTKEKQLTVAQSLNMWQNMSGTALSPIQRQALERIVNLIAQSYYKKGQEDFANNIGEEVPESQRALQCGFCGTILSPEDKVCPACHKSSVAPREH